MSASRTSPTMSLWWSWLTEMLMFIVNGGLE